MVSLFDINSPTPYKLVIVSGAELLTVKLISVVAVPPMSIACTFTVNDASGRPLKSS